MWIPLILLVPFFIVWFHYKVIKPAEKISGWKGEKNEL